MKRLYAYQTALGTFYICRTNRLFYAMLGGEFLNTYATPELAAANLAAGLYVPGVVDTRAVTVSAELGDWEKLC